MNFIIKRKILIMMLFAGLTMLGYFSYQQLPVELLPNATYPKLFVYVGTSLEVDPKYMENQAIIPLEGAIGTLEGVEEIESSADQRQGEIRISYSQSTDLKYAYLKLVEKIDEAKKNLPQEFMVQVYKFDLEQFTNMFMNIQVRGGGGIDRIRQITDTEILNRIKNIDGIANAQVFGGREKSIEIILHEDVCESYGITASDVQNALNKNSKARSFAGKVTKNSQLHFVNVVSEFDNINDIHELIVKDEGKIKLKDIAQIHYGVKEQESYSRVNGKEAVTIQLTRDSQANIIDLAHVVMDQMDEINEEFAEKDIEMVVQYNSAEIMEKNIDLIIQLAIVGGILAIFILWVFLKNLRLVIAIALAIPISVYTAFNFFYAAEISINSLTLLGMALAIGMLLDNSIVVLENIYRLAAKKLHPDKAVVQGTKEVWRSIFAATLTTIMVFLPFAFSTRFEVALLGKNIGVSIISTLLVSMVVALLLVPMITHTFLLRKKKSKPIQFESISFHNRLIQIYMVFLKSCMRYPGRTIFSALGLFFVMLLINGIISMASNEEPEIKSLTLYVTMPGGTTLDNTDAMVVDVETILAELEEKKDVMSQVYEEEAVITISLLDDFRDVRNYSVPKIKDDILERLEDIQQAEFSWDPPAGGRRFGGGGNDDDGFQRMMGIGSNSEKILVKGQDFDKMLNTANDAKYFISQLTSIRRVDVQIPAKRPELMLNFDKQLLSLYDIPVTAVLAELNSFQHEFSSGVSFKQGTEEYDILIKTLTTDKQKERDVADLKQLPVRSAQGALFDLENVSAFNFTNGISSIRRTNQEKQLEIVFEFVEEVQDDKDLMESARLEIDELISNMKIPSGTALEVVEEDNQLAEFGFILAMAAILIYMILASVFESFSKPFVMMFAIPMAAIGSGIMLILTGTSIMDANVITGFLILLGIVVNNGIIMLDYARVLRGRGYRESRALMMAGLARVRPILITAITTIIALIPLALGRAEYVTQIGVPFAITVIGGLTTSTILTLVFIPTVSSSLEAAISWIRNQKILIKAVIFSLWIIGSYLIFTEIDRRIWQIIVFVVLIIGVPGVLYFVKNSLRRASEKVIDEEASLIINIRNLVKIYDRDNRFTRELKSGLRIRERLGFKHDYTSIKDFDQLVWQLPLVGFTVFFIYVHLQSALWFFILPAVLYIMVNIILKPVHQYLDHLKTQNKRKWIRRLVRFTCKLFFWAFPAFAMYLFFDKYTLAGLVIPFAFVWYLAVFIKVTADNLYKKNVNVNRIKGRFKGIRKGFYRFVLVIPILGKRKTPFKAVKGVSFEIGNGMFGLLGPNGAGKSTLMRIICGILEQSYGQITINGIDVREKREELQGLIGYLPQEFGMYENMTAWDFLQYMAILKKIYNKEERDERVEYVLNAVHMFKSKDEKIGSFSGGMKQRIGIAQILLHLPRILVVDEPTAGLDPRERIRFRNLLVELSKERIVIFSTHIIEDVASSCNRVAVMKKGNVKYLGAPIDMAGIAKGKVWSMDVPADEFDNIKDDLTIIHHMRDGDTIRLRCLADEAPGENAKTVNANLEDAYLCLLKDSD